MATEIRLKRSDEDTSSIKLKKGEPYYNLKKKHLFIGNKDDDSVSADTGKKHLTEITSKSIAEQDDIINFYIGEDTNNEYHKKINNVDNADKANSLTWQSFKE